MVDTCELKMFTKCLESVIEFTDSCQVHGKEGKDTFLTIPESYTFLQLEILGNLKSSN